MKATSPLADRRRFMQGLALGAAAFYTDRGLFAELLDKQLVLTPAQTEGPFYPKPLPLDTDNNLIVINDALTPAVGHITHLTGRLLTPSGSLIRNAEVEIWQCDNNGVYIHPKSGNASNRDSNFQGFGRFSVGSSGEYYFRTIQPVPYTGRTPHIHFKIKKSGRPDFITQCYIRGHAENAKDGVLKGIKDPKQLNSVMVDFLPIKESMIGEVSARFDIVLGWTPETKS
jgi:protocatechuate 3,4-dioxygenase, beta subunit